MGELPAPFSAIGEISDTGDETAVFWKMDRGNAVAGHRLQSHNLGPNFLLLLSIFEQWFCYLSC